MAHFAELDENNKVLRVIVVNNEELIDNGVESESKGIAFCEKLFGGSWKQTSYNASFRKHFAGIDFIYDEKRDIFIEPQPFASWTKNPDTYIWEPPVPFPNDGKFYRWNEAELKWDEVTLPN